MDKPNTGHTDEEERIEHAADGRFVLIGAEHEQISEGKTKLNDAGIQVNKQG